MSQSQLRTLTIRLIVMASGLTVFVYYFRLFRPRSLVETLAFIAAITLVRLFDLRLSAGEEVSLDASFTLAALLLFSFPDALLVSIGGLLLAALAQQPKVNFGGPLYLVAQRSLVILLAGLWLNGRYLLASADNRLNFFSWQALLVLGAGITYFLVELSLQELDNSLSKATPFWPSFLGALQFLAQIYLALASIGVLAALMYNAIGIYTLLLFAVPLIVVRYSFRLFLDIKNMYRHTIAALSRIIEVEDPNQRSHSERVADLATDIAKELGLTGNRLEAVGYAALLHDIGKLGLDVNSFDMYLDTKELSEDHIPHALIGAEILEQVEFLRSYAPIVAKHHLPFISSRRHVDVTHPLESRIIAVANYYDQLTLTREVSQRLTPNQAVAKIKKEAFQFDPKAVRALINVLRRQGKLIVARKPGLDW